ncbi:carbohydrate-binding domain-containing protein [Anaerosacchariphilus polymeriproducens]|uniref:Carbohydrate-binding domain-containing protein n=1 Tax=Anaerosacchariphilus polymeriproducens TaxID=1812858 RepID=A0A371AY35_9FIRM|nr:carbohydrate-binding domain-containing protein [Anaerosacchariphilus polymeriproducens]RDU24495.1 carbohydrate-binding domain-containing protein [Anaerosacchariphilus polymeriproducens]
MRIQWKKYVIITTIIATLLTGCGSKQSSGTTTSSTNSVTDSSTSSSTTSTTATAMSLSTSQVVIDKEFSDRDLDSSYDDSNAVHITLNDSSIEADSESGLTIAQNTLTITKEGTYVISGTLNDGNIIVDADDTAKIQIVLNGVTITSSDYAPIYVKTADKVFITLAENTDNSLTDGSEYVQTDDTSVDGVIFSKADLTLNGNGTLNITGNYKHGIASKDDLIITSGTYNITAVKDGLNGKDAVKVKDGTITISVTDGDGIQSKNGDDSTKGYVYICDGTINIKNSQEGIEGTAILIENGTIDIVANDDGINATSESKGDGDFGGKGGGTFENDTNVYLSISGGTITIDASGDGIDSNGSVIISGGTTIVNGPTNSGNAGFDYNGTADISGGTILVAGSAGMAQGFSDTSTQYSILYNFSSVSEAGTEVSLTDADGNKIYSYTPTKQYQSIVISTPDLKKDATYTLTSGSQSEEITLSSVITSGGEQSVGGHGGDQGGRGMKKFQDGGQAPDMGGTGNSETTDSGSSN